MIKDKTGYEKFKKKYCLAKGISLSEAKRKAADVKKINELKGQMKMF